METIISSAEKKVVIGDNHPTVLIGERINPAGKRKMSEELRLGNLEIVRREALAQAKAGADIIDVCVSTFGVDEVTLLPRAVQAVMETVDVPLCIDSTKPEALEAALKIYNGRPLINSVTGEEKSLESILPLVKEYKAAVIGLVQDDEGIPKNWERRAAIAHKIVERAETVGIPKEDIIIDCLTLAVGADTRSGRITIETVHRVKAELGVKVILGASNISFGLPERNVINNAFIAIAISAGVNCLIADAAKVRPAVLAADLLLSRDEYARRYVEAYRKHQKSFAHL
jgi:5-methyltetrahydrofolate--homocysteine methyltransferase